MTTTPANFSPPPPRPDRQDRQSWADHSDWAEHAAWADLDSLDLIRSEAPLCAGLRRFFEFKGYTLHFPLVKDNDEQAGQAEYLPREHKLLLPLRRPGGRLLGVFVARGVGPAVKKILPWLPAAAGLCLENLRLRKQSLLDPLSGLLRRDHLLDLAARELDRLRESLRPGGPKDLLPEDAADAAGSVCPAGPIGSAGPAVSGAPAAAGPIGPARGFRFSLMAIRLNGLAALVREHGYLRTEKLLAALAAELEKNKPGQATAARSGDAEFALLLPACGPQASRELGQTLIARLNAVQTVNELNGRKLRVNASAGFVECPRDLDGMERHPAPEQARRLLRRARLAAAMAAQSALADAGAVPVPAGLRAFAEREEKPAVLSYGGILTEGGRVLEVRPLARLEVSLGKYCGARPGQRFTLWGYALERGGRPARRYKGEVLLTRVRPGGSTAELLYCDDPSLPPEPGDQLILSGQSHLPEPGPESAAPPARLERPDKATGFLSYSDFLPLWCREREKHERFSLVLARFSLPLLTGSEQAVFMEYLEEEGDTADETGLLDDAAAVDPESAGPAARSAAPLPPNGDFPHYDRRGWEDRMGTCAERFRETLGPEALYGRYGLNSFVAFVPETSAASTPAALARLAGSLSREFAGAELHSAFGIAPYPFLDFHKAESLENVHKALEYALLLPMPHVGVLDSLALNISADRRYSLGDQLGAIAEYKKALLCDENNILAWNSLGVCLAGLGRPAEARRHFEEALGRSPDNAAALYNLAQLCQSQGETGEAERLFLRCLELDPAGVYPLYRLGQLAEQRGDNALARDYYRRTAELPGGEALTRRGLARLSIKEGRLEEAREELHEALLVNPNDALALQLLAGLYLDAGENPAVAESLARQSAALRPDFKAAWLELARALEASGKAGEAREALLRAGEL